MMGREASFPGARMNTSGRKRWLRTLKLATWMKAQISP